MIKKNALAILATAALATTNASRAENVYAGLSIAANKYEEGYYITDTRLVSASGRLGVNLGKFASTEIRIGTGLIDDTVYFYRERYNLNVDSMYGAYLRLGGPLTDTLYPYVVAGYTKTKLTLENKYESVSDSENDISYGLGLDITTKENFAINLEYIRRLDKGIVEFSGLSLGFTVTF